MNTLFYWLITAGVLIVCAGLIGRKATFIGSDGQEHKGNWLGIFIDDRLRYSLTHFQIVLWALVWLSLFAAIFLAGLLDGNPADALSITIPPEILALAGISGGSAVLTTAIKAPRTDGIRRATLSRAKALKNSKDSKDSRDFKGSHFAQIFLEEEGDAADKVIDVTKFQNFFLTLIAVGAYIALAVTALGVPGVPEGLPGFNQDLLWLIGISHAAYVGGKFPEKQ